MNHEHRRNEGGIVNRSNKDTSTDTTRTVRLAKDRRDFHGRNDDFAPHPGANRSTQRPGSPSIPPRILYPSLSIAETRRLLFKATEIEGDRREAIFDEHPRVAPRCLTVADARQRCSKCLGDVNRRACCRYPRDRGQPTTVKVNQKRISCDKLRNGVGACAPSASSFHRATERAPRGRGLTRRAPVNRGILILSGADSV